VVGLYLDRERRRDPGQDPLGRNRRQATRRKQLEVTEQSHGTLVTSTGQWLPCHADLFHCLTARRGYIAFGGAIAEARRKFDEDFKTGAVRIVRESGRPTAPAASLTTYDEPNGTDVTARGPAARLRRPLFVTRTILRRIVAALGTHDAQLRAELVGSQIIGLAIARYVVRLPSVASADVEDLVIAVGPTVQRYLAGDIRSAGG
jgi:Tetracyclin repressor-like, C-terminal domain